MRSETSNWSRSLVNRYHCTSSLSPWVSLRLCRHCPPPTYPGSASGSPVERNLRINFPELRSSPAILYSSNGLWRTCWQAYGGWTADLTIIYSVRRFVMGYVLPTEHVFASLLRVSSWRDARKLIRLLDHLDDNNTFAIIF